MMKATGLDRVCSVLAARRCRNEGQSVAQIAASAKVHPSTVYRWLKDLPLKDGEVAEIYEGYQICASGDNFRVRDSRGYYAWSELAVNIPTARKWIDQHLADLRDRRATRS